MTFCSYSKHSKDIKLQIITLEIYKLQIQLILIRNHPHFSGGVGGILTLPNKADNRTRMASSIETIHTVNHFQ